MVTHHRNIALTRLVTMDKIEIHVEKVPGANGYPTFFFKKL